MCAPVRGEHVCQPVHQQPRSCLSSHQANELELDTPIGKWLIRTTLPPYLEMRQLRSKEGRDRRPLVLSSPDTFLECRTW